MLEICTFDVPTDGRKLPKYSITATLQCAGNRRISTSKNRKVKGVGWDVAAIGNDVWGGAKLADVLELIGIPKNSRVTPFGGKHVEFVSIDKCKEENGGPYKVSIPLTQATNPEADVSLAYEMNGELLTGIMAIHCVLLSLVSSVLALSNGWIASTLLPWNARDSLCKEITKCFHLRWIGIISTGLQGGLKWTFLFSVQYVLWRTCMVKVGKIKIKGYAASGGGRGIERIDVSVDGGKTWFEALKFQKPGVPYVSDDASNDKWAWVLFEAEAEISQGTEIVAKAVDSAANLQPENVAVI